MFDFARRLMPLFLLWCAVAALWLDLSRIHLGQTSDSLIPVLVSLQHWTPFYWEQSRFGMLVPLLATPLQHPLVNLLVQNGLTIFAGLAAIGLMARFFIRSRAWFAAACASCVILLICLAEPLRCDYLLAQPYGVSFSLGLGALLVLDHKATRLRWCVATGLIMLSGWVNLAVGPALLLIVLSRWAGQGFRPRRAPSRLVLLTVLGAIAGAAFESCAPYRDAHVTRLAPVGRWLASSARLITNAIDQSGSFYLCALALLLTIAVPALLLTSRRGRRAAGSCAISLFLAAALLVLLAAANRWAERNGFMPRYIYMALLAVQTGVVGAITVSLGQRPSVSRTWLCAIPRRACAGALAVAALAAVGFTFGRPSIEGAREALNQRLGADSDKILCDGCTHVAGNYWRVWPAVFHANWQLRQRGETRMVWGVTYRSLPTEQRWAPRELDNCRLLILDHDEHAEALLRRHFSFAFAAKDRKLPKS